jgi:hypothetical protein
MVNKVPSQFIYPREFQIAFAVFYCIIAIGVFFLLALSSFNQIPKMSTYITTRNGYSIDTRIPAAPYLKYLMDKADEIDSMLGRHKDLRDKLQDNNIPSALIIIDTDLLNSRILNLSALQDTLRHIILEVKLLRQQYELDLYTDIELIRFEGKSNYENMEKIKSEVEEHIKSKHKVKRRQVKEAGFTGIASVSS